MARFRAFGCALLSVLGLSGPVWAQDADRIWGRVHTTSGEVHEGFIRWDRNEVSWVDILDGSKEVPGENYLAWLESRGDEPPVRTIDLLGFRISWEESDPDFPSTSASGIRFGHLSSLRVIGRDHVELALRSGELLDLEGGAVRRSIREISVDVAGRGRVELDRSEFDQVHFSAVPSGARASARRLHGTVEDRQGNRYTGYVSWDRDGILTSDVLEGEEVDGGDERQIRFDEIASIARVPGGARIVLVNGVERDLTGTRDVGRRNRGIQISDLGLGRVEVEWSEFRVLRLHEPERVVGYDAFDGGRLLVGTVVTQSGEEIDGLIRWDADEAASWEMLNGRADDVDFTIELGNVAGSNGGKRSGPRRLFWTDALSSWTDALSSWTDATSRWTTPMTSTGTTRGSSSPRWMIVAQAQPTAAAAPTHRAGVWSPGTSSGRSASGPMRRPVVVGWSREGR